MKAYTTKVTIGNLTIDGLMDEQGNYFVAVPQIADLTMTSRNTLSRDLKRLLGADLKTSKLTTGFNRNTTNGVSLLDFERILVKLDRKGNKAAQDLRDDLTGLALTQLFSDAFGVKFEAEDRQQYLVDRQEGKQIRRTLTDAISDYLHSQGKGDAFGYYARVTNMIYLGVFNMEAKQIRNTLSVPDHRLTRDYFNSKELRTIAMIEDMCMNLVDDGTHPFESVAISLDIMKKSRITLQPR